jgi:LysM repeat protein
MGKRVYRVKPGDDFIKISRKLYGDPSYVMDLMRANPGFNWLGPGMVLRLPKEDPRVTRQRKIKRRMKDYVPPPEETEEQLDWWDDPEFEEKMANVFAETALSIGLDANVLREELGLGEGSPLLAVESSNNWTQSRTEKGNLHSPRTSLGQDTQPPTGEGTTPPVTLTDEQIDTLKEELEKLGLDVDVAMEELGLGEGAVASSSSTTSQAMGEGVDGGDEAKDSSGGKVAKPAMPEVPPPTLTADGAYIVQEGDTLTGIAAIFGLPLDAVIQANPDIVDPNYLQVGQEVIIPLNSPETPSPTTTPTPTPTSTEPSTTPPTSKQTQGDGIPQIPPDVFTRRDLLIWLGRQMDNPNLDDRDKERLEKLYLSNRRALPVAHPNEITLLFSGGDGGPNLDNPGPLASDQTFAWLQDVYSASIPEDQWVQYPGVKRDKDGNPIPPYDKHHQVLMGLEKDTGDKDLNLIGYSAGADTCLMYAYEQVKKGKKVKTMILLDPSMTGDTVDGRKLDGIYNGDKKPLKDPLWKIMLDEIIKSGTDVIIVDDPEDDKRDPEGKLIGPAEYYQAPVGESEDGVKYGNYHYEPQSSDRPHWDKEGEKHGIGTNNDWGFSADMNKYFWDWKAEKLNW